jgi:hypothetical protein
MKGKDREGGRRKEGRRKEGKGRTGRDREKKRGREERKGKERKGRGPHLFALLKQDPYLLALLAGVTQPRPHHRVRVLPRRFSLFQTLDAVDGLFSLASVQRQRLFLLSCPRPQLLQLAVDCGKLRLRGVCFVFESRQLWRGLVAASVWARIAESALGCPGHPGPGVEFRKVCLVHGSGRIPKQSWVPGKGVFPRQPRTSPKESTPKESSPKESSRKNQPLSPVPCPLCRSSKISRDRHPFPS